MVGIASFCTWSGGGGAPSPGQALQNRVGPLMEGGELEGLKAADGQTAERQEVSLLRKQVRRTGEDGEFRPGLQSRSLPVMNNCTDDGCGSAARHPLSFSQNIDSLKILDFWSTEVPH